MWMSKKANLLGETWSLAMGTEEEVDLKESRIGDSCQWTYEVWKGGENSSITDNLGLII